MKLIKIDIKIEKHKKKILITTFSYTESYFVNNFFQVRCLLLLE